MDFNRGGQIRLNNATNAPAANRQASAGTAGSDSGRSASGSGSNFKKSLKDGSRVLRWSYISLLISGTILFVAMICFLVFGSPVYREAKYIDDTKYQAVFVNVNGTNGGQVYFGRITSMTSQYIRLTNVFYIQNQQTDDTKTGSSYNLVKLGCELHGPTDEMLFNRDQVFFWENLKSDSQVSQKAAEFYKQNPNGQKCDTSAPAAGSEQQTTQTPAETSKTTTPTTTPETKKPTTSTTPTSGQ